MANLLAVEQWRSYMSYHPMHFYMLTNSIIPVTSACNTLVNQYAWQGPDKCGRSEIATAIETAEDKLTAWLHYSPMLHYTTETLEWPRYPDNRVWRLGWADGSSHWISVKLKEGYIDAVGYQRQTLIGTTALTYSDADGDGLNDTFVATIVTTVTNPTALHVYFAAADRLDSEGPTARWQIRPVSITITGGVATIRGRAWMMVRPILYEGFTTTGLNPSTAGNFVTSVDVYSEYIDPDGLTYSDSQATLIWETLPYPQWVTYSSPPDNSRDPAAVAYTVARCGIRDAETGIVHAAKSEYDATTGQWSVAGWTDYVHRPPDRLIIRYRAGYPLENGEMAKKFQVIIARMAAAELVRPICACDTANRELYRWQFDMSRSAGANDEQYSIAAEDLNNPFGTRAGHVYAWREVKHLRQLPGLLAN